MRRSLVRVAGLALLAAATSCADSSSAPSRRMAQISFAPAFSPADAAVLHALSSINVIVDNVEVTVMRSGADVSPLLDTTVTFPVTATQISIDVAVELSQQEEQLDAVIALRAGDLILFRGGQSFIARAGATSRADKPLVVSYVGPGAETQKLTMSTKSLGTHVGGKVPLLATATDANGLVVKTALLTWSSTNPAIATVDAQGLITGVAMGTTSIVARTPNGIADTASLRVTAPPARLALVSGDGQRGTVGDLLQQPFVVQALDATGAGVPGATISFAVTSGGGTVQSTSMLTDDKGIASVSLTLGTIAGDNAFTASFGTLTPITVHATALASIPSVVAVVSGGDQTGTAGFLLPKPLVARVMDAYGNPVGGISVNWTALSREGSSVGSTSSGADGTTSLDYVLPTFAGPDAITARISTQGTQATAVFNVVGNAGTPAGLQPVPGSDFQTVDACANPTLKQPLAVQTVDQFGNAAPLPGLSVTFRIDSGFATFGDSQAPSAIVLTDAAGIATATTYAPSSSALQTVTAGAVFPGQRAEATTQFTITASLVGCANRLPNDGRKLPSAPGVPTSSAMARDHRGVVLGSS